MASTCRRAASASPACRPSRRRSATRSSPPPESASGGCRSASNSRPDTQFWRAVERGFAAPLFFLRHARAISVGDLESVQLRVDGLLLVAADANFFVRAVLSPRHLTKEGHLSVFGK